MRLVLELTFYCIFKQMFCYLESITPLELSQDKHTRKHTCKLEAGVHDVTSSLVHIYPLILIVLSPIFLFITFWCFNSQNYQHNSSIYIWLKKIIAQFFPSPTSWPPSTAVPIYIFSMEEFQVFYSFYWQYVLVVYLA